MGQALNQRGGLQLELAFDIEIVQELANEGRDRARRPAIEPTRPGFTRTDPAP